MYHTFHGILLLYLLKSRKYLPNIIQQDIHPDIRPAGNSPAEYSAGTYFYLCKTKSRIMYGMYGQNDSHFTKWHTKSFQNITLVSHYSKSVSRKNSKCLHFVLVQVTPIVKKAEFLLHATQDQKMTPIPQNGIPRASKLSN